MHDISRLTIGYVVIPLSIGVFIRLNGLGRVSVDFWGGLDCVEQTWLVQVSSTSATQNPVCKIRRTAYLAQLN